MKKIKNLTAVILAVLLIAAMAVPVMAETPVIALTVPAPVFDVAQDITFTADIPDGFTSARVICGNKTVQTIAPSTSPYTVTIPANTLPGMHQTELKVEADYAGGTSSASRNVALFELNGEKRNVFTQNFDATEVAMSDALKAYPNATNSFDSALWNHTRTFGYNLGLNGGLAPGRAIYSAGTGMDGTPALSLKDENNTAAAYFEYTFSDTLGKGIVCISADIFMSTGDAYFMALTMDDGAATYQIDKSNATLGQWNTFKVYYDLYSKLIYFNIGDNMWTFERGYYKGSNPTSVKSIRVNMNPIQGNTMLIDNFSIDYYPTADHVITLSDLEPVYDVASDITFTADIPAGFDSAAVYYGDKAVQTIQQGTSPYTITIPANTLKAVYGAELSVKASYCGKEISASKTINTVACASPARTVFTQDFNGIQDAIDAVEATYKTDFDYKVWNHTRTLGVNLGLNGGLVAARTPYSIGVGKDGTPALSVDKPADANGGYFDYYINPKLGKGIVCVTADVFMNTEDSYYPTLYLNDGTVMFGINKHNAELGKWHTFKMYFDMYTQTMYCGDIEIPFSNGYYIGDDPSMATQLRVNMNPATGSSIIIDNFSIKFYPTQPVFEVSPAKGELVYGPDVNITATIPGAAALDAVLIDGEAVQGSFDEDSGVVTVAATGLSYGIHNVEFAVTCDDGSGKVEKSSFTTVKVKGTKYEGALIEAETFDDMAESYDRFNGDFNSRTYANSTISRIQGARATHENDYAPLIVHKSGAGEAVMYMINHNINSTAWNSLGGYYVAEFDYYMNHSGYEAWISNMGLWGSSTTFISSKGVLLGTEITLTNKTWYNFRLVLDRAEDKWYVWLDGELVVDGVARTQTTYSDFYFRLRAANSTTSPSFGVDNVRIYNTDFEPAVISASYTAGSDAELGSVIPLNTAALTFKYNKAPSVTAESVKVYADGAELEATATVSDKTVTLALPALKANSDLEIVLGDGLSDNTIKLGVADADGCYVNSDIISFADGDAKAVITGTNSGDAKSAKAAVALYSTDGKTLKSVEIRDISLANGDFAEVVTGSATPDATRLKVMVLDGTNVVKPVIKSASR